MRTNLLLATALLALLSLILAMPLAWITNHLLGPEGFSIARGLWLNLSLGSLILLALGVPVANAYRRRQARAAARPVARPMHATIIAVKETPVQSKRRGVRLTLDVALPTGRRRVQTHTWLVGKADRQRLVPGTPLNVKVDPNRPQHVFPDCDWLAEA